MHTKQLGCQSERQDPDNLVWKMFWGTGQVGTYLLYKELQEEGREDWGELPEGPASPQVAES